MRVLSFCRFQIRASVGCLLLSSIGLGWGRVAWSGRRMSGDSQCSTGWWAVTRDGEKDWGRGGGGGGGEGLKNKISYGAQRH